MIVFHHREGLLIMDVPHSSQAKLINTDFGIPASLSGMYLSAAQACRLPLEYPTTQNLSLTPTAFAKCNMSIADDLRFLLGWGSLSPKPGRSYVSKRMPNSSSSEALSPGIPNQKNDTKSKKKKKVKLCGWLYTTPNVTQMNCRALCFQHFRCTTCKPGGKESMWNNQRKSSSFSRNTLLLVCQVSTIRKHYEASTRRM